MNMSASINYMGCPHISQNHLFLGFSNKEPSLETLILQPILCIFIVS